MNTICSEEVNKSGPAVMKNTSNGEILKRKIFILKVLKNSFFIVVFSYLDSEFVFLTIVFAASWPSLLRKTLYRF